MKIPIHEKFQLNGIAINSFEELMIQSQSISDEIYIFLSELFDDKSYIEVKTSGSTGVPKIIEIPKVYLIHSAQATGEYFQLYEGTTALLCMNPNFIAGKMMLVRAIVLGWSLDVVPPSLTPLSGVEKLYDFSAMVPLQVSNSLNDLFKIHKLIIGGGVVSKELDNQIQEIDTRCYATYGMTETVTHIAVKKLNGMGKSDVYETLAGVSVHLDERGCVVIDAPKVASETVITNDLAQVFSPKEFVWLGRYDNIINSGGIKLIPEQIERKIVSFVNQRFFVTGLEDAVLGQKLVIVVEGNGDQITLDDIDQIESLEKYEKPKEIYFVPQFIETETKKVQRQKTLQLIFD